ncbi:hydroxyethylthiazole kinase [Psychrobacillus vulpis]|uniref:Hydroxyethylthiazole kinase n=1 Tax=Psychrobacillus vulpis TaxID=2325572 RepID=A0A544TTP7_9BACI|nr:hydroxyethylthiazole kinase [Psychrobacillus vulpis]TQR20847.1 hydroxyethylthiazole kinase [Psychrobacillus vulpis]
MNTITRIRKGNPLIHCITNIVVANFKANGLLAVGASPVMADAIEEVEEMTGIASGLLINIGTLHARSVEAMKLAGKRANQVGIPLVLDPVGAGATSYRLNTVREILEEVNIQVLRCNVGELAAIANSPWEAKGVDSGKGELDVVFTAQEVAKKYNCIVAVSGEVDIVTDGKQVEEIIGGDARMPLVTGSGCLLSALCCSAVATTEKDDFQAVVDVMHFYKRIGEYAGRNSIGAGDFAVHILNGLDLLSKREEVEWSK